MAAIAPITVFDGASTPVSHTLSPISVTRSGDSVTALWRENSLSVPVYASISASMKIERLKSGNVFRVEMRVEVPVMESISGQNAAGYTAAPKVAYVNTMVLSAFFHDRSDGAGRRLVRQLALNLGGGIATSVTPNTTSPAAELFDLLTSPT